MDEALKPQILSLLDDHRTMTIATARPDGWPQATTVGYANEGMTLYFLCGRDSQKAHNLANDSRVSITINDDPTQVMAITGLSLAGRAEPITNATEAVRVIRLLMQRYPEQTALSLDLPDPKDVALFKVQPTVISLLDYAKGFGHTDLVTV